MIGLHLLLKDTIHFISELISSFVAIIGEAELKSVPFPLSVIHRHYPNYPQLSPALPRWLARWACQGCSNGREERFVHCRMRHVY
jgi:hypothetical protein